MTIRGLLAVAQQWAPAPTGPQAEQAPLPPDISGFSVIVLVLFGLSLLLVLRKRWKKQRGYRSSPGGAAMGNALFDINAVFQPHHANAAVICKLEEEEEQDDAGEGPEPWTRPGAPPNEDPYREPQDLDLN